MPDFHSPYSIVSGSIDQNKIPVAPLPIPIKAKIYKSSFNFVIDKNKILENPGYFIHDLFLPIFKAAYAQKGIDKKELALLTPKIKPWYAWRSKEYLTK